MTKKAKIITAIIVTVVIVAGVWVGIYLSNVNTYQNTVAAITYLNDDISTIPDGSYIGECDVKFIYAKVKVTVKDGAITKVDLLEHRNERGGNAQSIGDDIVTQQKVDVDEISGATNSSKVIKKAVDNALTSAIKQP